MASLNFFLTAFTPDFRKEDRILPCSKNGGILASNQGFRLPYTKESANPSARARDKIDKHNCSPSGLRINECIGGLVLCRELALSCCSLVAEVELAAEVQTVVELQSEAELELAVELEWPAVPVWMMVFE